jgi:HEAT repeat protein
MTILRGLALLMGLAAVAAGFGQSSESEILRWNGWRYAGEKPLTFNKNSFAKTADWTPVLARAESIGLSPGGLPFRLRVFVWTRADVLQEGSDGVLRTRRSGFSDSDVLAITTGIQRLAAAITTSTDGALRASAEVSAETDVIRDRIMPGDEPFDEAIVKAYVEPRINGGTYDAEDRKFRGPYHGVIVISPSPAAQGQSVFLKAMGTPVVRLSCSVPTPAQLDVVLAEAYRQIKTQRATEAGYLRGGPPSDDFWAAVGSLADPSAEDLIRRRLLIAALLPEIPISRVDRSWRTESTSVSVVKDPNRGDVLQMRSATLARSDGMELPVPEGGWGIPVTGRTLRMQARTENDDPFLITVKNETRVKRFVLGRDLASPAEAGQDQMLSAVTVPLSPSGQWQTVELDVSEFSGSAVMVAIEPTQNALVMERRSAQDIVLELDDVEFLDAAPTAREMVANEEELLLARLAKARSAGTPTAESAAALASGSDLVRLNAAACYLQAKDSATESALIALTSGISPFRQEMAIRACAFLGTPKAIEALRALLRRSPSDHARAVAAEVLSDLKPAGLLGDLTILIAGRSTRTQMAAADAMSKLGGREAGIALATFLSQQDPQLKVHVTRLVDPKDDFQMRRVLWSAVNEPSDAVRAESGLKLIRSSNAEWRAEGWKLVRDESVGARLHFLAGLSSVDLPEFAEEARAALRLALTDRSPRVRATAVRALIRVSPKTVVEDTSAVKADPHPWVREALESVDSGA